jgi:hypothetical protein
MTQECVAAKSEYQAELTRGRANHVGSSFATQSVWHATAGEATMKHFATVVVALSLGNVSTVHAQTKVDEEAVHNLSRIIDYGTGTPIKALPESERPR